MPFVVRDLGRDLDKRVRLELRVTPRAGCNAVAGVREGRLQVKVTAPPEDGKANAAVVRLLSKLWKVQQSAFEITAGHAARDKTLLLRGVRLSELPELGT